QVKCDKRPGRCMQCERLQLDCFGSSEEAVESLVNGRSSARVEKRTRTYRSCNQCRSSKLKCSGERPKCRRCAARSIACVYDTDSAPAWIRSIEQSTRRNNEPREESTMSAEAENSESNDLGIREDGLYSWLFSRALPSVPLRRRLAEQYFNHHHPLRCFGFIHKPSFMQRLDEDKLSSKAELALLYIVCAIGVKFYALHARQDQYQLSLKQVQLAGSQWAKQATSMILGDYGNISIENLMATLLLHDYEIGSGNHAQAFLLSALTARMASALQINLEYSTDILYVGESRGAPSAVEREERRRLMWACYDIDTWNGSGVEQLTLLNETDIKIQLPCNSRDFLHGRPTITQNLQSPQDLEFITPVSMPIASSESLGIIAHYIRLVAIWKRILRYFKHLDEAAAPWLPDSEFSNIESDLRRWKNDLPESLQWNASSIYIRRESSQLGALLVLNCIYHQTVYDLYRIGLPELFNIREHLHFPLEQKEYQERARLECFNNAQQIAVILSTALQHGADVLADTKLPSLTYNANRVMLYYLARYISPNSQESQRILAETVKHIKGNNEALRAMSPLFPLALALVW
ncbi:hypothetical protein NA57DRAFT_39491, partial [Rhizodiscina lignyota]